MLTLLAKLLQALNSENSSRQIALAIALAFIFGLSPFLSLQAFALLFVVLLIKVHLASFILASGVFIGTGYVLQSSIIGVGESLLTSSAFTGVFSTLYQADLFKLAHLHHTHNLGALVVGLVLALPLYLAAKILIEKYRVHIKAYFEKLSIVRALKASKIFTIYSNLTPQGNG